MWDVDLNQLQDPEQSLTEETEDNDQYFSLTEILYKRYRLQRHSFPSLIVRSPSLLLLLNDRTDKFSATR